MGHCKTAHTELRVDRFTERELSIDVTLPPPYVGNTYAPAQMLSHKPSIELNETDRARLNCSKVCKMPLHMPDDTGYKRYRFALWTLATDCVPLLSGVNLV